MQSIAAQALSRLCCAAGLLQTLMAAAATLVVIGALGCAGFFLLNYIHIGKYSFQLGTAAPRAFDAFVLTVAHGRHYIEFFAAAAFQIIKRHDLLPPLNDAVIY